MKFGAREASFYGKLNIDIELGIAEPPFIFQLLDVEYNVISEQTITKSDVVSYAYLRPGDYTFRPIQDLNNNGEWDTGEYESKTQPEPIIYFHGTTNVRSNWEVDLKWGIEFE